MVNGRIIYKKSSRIILFTLLAASLALAACDGSPAAPANTTAPPTPTVAPSSPGAPVPLPATLTAVPIPPAANGDLTIPPNWYSTIVDLTNLHGRLFVKHDPAALAAFDDPTLAVPADFAGGALINTPLPPGADAGSLQAGMEANLSTLTDQDFEAMLIGADQIGLINLAAISQARLNQAKLDTLGGQPAILLEGTIHFADGQTPILQGQIWLTWTDESFVTFYALATESVWPSVIPELEEARNSLRLP